MIARSVPRECVCVSQTLYRKLDLQTSANPVLTVWLVVVALDPLETQVLDDVARGRVRVGRVAALDRDANDFTRNFPKWDR